MIQETPEEHKLRAVRITAAARFAGANRLRRHERYSLFSITMCSIAVIVISLLEPFGVKLILPPNAVNLVAATISLLILVISLLVSGSKYGERAEKMHAGGMEINSVGRRLEGAIKMGDAQLIDELSEEYENILKIYENHIDVDYRVAQIKRYTTHYKIGGFDRIWCWVLQQWDVALQVVPLAITVGIVCWLVRGAHL